MTEQPTLLPEPQLPTFWCEILVNWSLKSRNVKNRKLDRLTDGHSESLHAMKMIMSLTQGDICRLKQTSYAHFKLQMFHLFILDTTWAAQ